MEKFISWFLGLNEKLKSVDSNEDEIVRPLSNEEFEANQQAYFELEETIKQEQKIVIKSPTFDPSQINEYKGASIKKFEFRPQTWKQFIGQTEAKERANTIFKKANKGMKSHFLVDGIKGHGKTTFVELIATSLKAKIIKRIGKQIDEESLIPIINEINNSTEKHVILFIDELDTMDWKVIKVLNPIIESFEIAGKKIKPFIFAGATINKNILIKNNPDTLDRLPIHIKFFRYNAPEIGAIIYQYWKQLYADEKMSPEIIKTISENCKFNPRTSIGLLEEYIVENDITKVLKNCNILKDGLTNIDIKLLRILNKADRPMGANCLALSCGLAEKEYITEFEPYLLEYHYIQRNPSRSITEKGKEFLNTL